MAAYLVNTGTVVCKRGVYIAGRDNSSRLGIVPVRTAVVDVYEWFIANLHQLLGHDKCAASLGVPAEYPEQGLTKESCILCRCERGEIDRAEVMRIWREGR